MTDGTLNDVTSTAMTTEQTTDSSFIVPRSSFSPLPVPAANITTRLATMDDLPFMDALQKQHSKQLGFFPRAQMEGYIANGWVVIAEARGEGEGVRRKEEGESSSTFASSLTPYALPLAPTPVGYCASRDRYLKRDELGAVFQLCVVPGMQRGLIGATLLKRVFERAAYGCRLFCCWCAQDLAANRFWEAMGFVPIAFRAGSETKGPKGRGRIHIFWQRRIRQDDAATPYWFPSQTNGGSIRADRVVLPIPQGVRWDDADALRGIVQQMMMASGAGEGVAGDQQTSALALPHEYAGAGTGKRKRTSKKAKIETVVAEPVDDVSVVAKKCVTGGGFRFGAIVRETEIIVASPVIEEPRKQARPKPVRVKPDPKLIGAVRELRDRWLDHYNGNTGPAMLGKYDVGRRIGQTTPVIEERRSRRLAA